MSWRATWKRPSGPADVETTAHDVDLELRFRTVLFLDLFEYRSAQQTPLRAALAFNTPHVVCLECADLFYFEAPLVVIWNSNCDRALIKKGLAECSASGHLQTAEIAIRRTRLKRDRLADEFP